MSEPKENAPWVTFRPEIKVLDCTVRDGGLINAHQFEDNFVKAVYDTCIESGIDYMELGYKASKDQFARADHGDWKFCDEDDIRRITGENDSALKLTAMADAGTVAVILPTTAYILRLPQPPVRKMIEAGVIVALGTDFNPNAFCLSMVWLYAMSKK